jgi:hypothetical protein
LRLLQALAFAAGGGILVCRYCLGGHVANNGYFGLFSRYPASRAGDESGELFSSAGEEELFGMRWVLAGVRINVQHCQRFS